MLTIGCFINGCLNCLYNLISSRHSCALQFFPPLSEVRQSMLAQTVIFFQMRIACQEEQINANALIFFNTLNNLLIASNQRHAGRNSDIAESRPDIVMNKEIMYRF